jgi:hypothetical protein
MCITWAEGVFEYHPSFLRKRLIQPRADVEKEEANNTFVPPTQ